VGEEEVVEEEEEDKVEEVDEELRGQRRTNKSDIEGELG